MLRSDVIPISFVPTSFVPSFTNTPPSHPLLASPRHAASHPPVHTHPRIPSPLPSSPLLAPVHNRVHYPPSSQLGVLLGLFHLTMRRAPCALFPTAAVLMLEQSVTVDMLDGLDEWG